MTLTPRQNRAITALLTNSRIGDAAKSAGISERTISRWLSDAQFTSALQRAQCDTIAGTVRRLASLTDKAVSSIAKYLDHEQPYVAMRAADLLLRHWHELHELHELEQRITALESEVNNHATE